MAVSRRSTRSAVKGALRDGSSAVCAHRRADHRVLTDKLAYRRPQEDDRRSEPQRRAGCMKSSPVPDQVAGFAPCVRQLGSHELLVYWHDDEEGVGPVRYQKQSTEYPEPVTCLPPCKQPQEEANDGEGGLHSEAALVAGLPFSQERIVAEA